MQKSMQWPCYVSFWNRSFTSGRRSPLATSDLITLTLINFWLLLYLLILLYMFLIRTPASTLFITDTYEKINIFFILF